MDVTKGLVIADPWIGHILSGEKSWEMRSTGTSLRGWFGLIRKGSGTVVGVAKLVGIGDRLSRDQMISNIDKHRIPEQIIRSGAVAKWNVPWFLTAVQALRTPVPYRYKFGAVMWVEFDPEVTRAIEDQYSGQGSAFDPPPQSLKPAAVTIPASLGAVSVELLGERIEPAREQTQGGYIGRPCSPAATCGTITLTSEDFMDRFPEDCVGGSNADATAPRKILIDWGGISHAETDIDCTKLIFRGRAWVGSFFEKNGALEGDSVEVEKTGPRSYRLQLIKEVRAIAE